MHQAWVHTDSSGSGLAAKQEGSGLGSVNGQQEALAAAQEHCGWGKINVVTMSCSLSAVPEGSSNVAAYPSFSQPAKESPCPLHDTGSIPAHQGTRAHVHLPPPPTQLRPQRTKALRTLCSKTSERGRTPAAWPGASCLQANGQDLVPHWVETVDLLVSGTWGLQERL